MGMVMQLANAYVAQLLSYPEVDSSGLSHPKLYLFQSIIDFVFVLSPDLFHGSHESWVCSSCLVLTIRSQENSKFVFILFNILKSQNWVKDLIFCLCSVNKSISLLLIIRWKMEKGTRIKNPKKYDNRICAIKIMKTKITQCN